MYAYIQYISTYFWCFRYQLSGVFKEAEEILLNSYSHTLLVLLKIPIFFYEMLIFVENYEIKNFVFNLMVKKCNSKLVTGSFVLSLKNLMQCYHKRNFYRVIRRLLWMVLSNFPGLNITSTTYSSCQIVISTCGNQVLLVAILKSNSYR